MKPHAFLIQAHNDQQFLRFLVESMSRDWTHFFIHIDAKFDIAPFRRELAGLDRVEWVEDRVKIYWAGWSQVQATLNTLAQARRSGIAFDSFTLMSGNQFPVRSMEEICGQIESSQDQYMSLLPAPNDDGKPMSKFNRYHMDGGSRPHGLSGMARALLLRAVSSVPLRDPYSYLPEGWKLYSGGNWWTLTEAAIAQIETSARVHPRIVELFRYVHCSDEAYFHTILGNSPFGARCVGSTVYTDWTNPMEQPAWIGESHLLYLLADPVIDNRYGRRKAHFARKVGSRNRFVAKALMDRSLLSRA